MNHANIQNSPYDNSFYEAQQSRSLSSARVILGMVFPMLRHKIKSVLDVGGGVGTWLRAASEFGTDEILCIDGDYVDRSMLQINPIYFQAADIANERLVNILDGRTRKTFDMTICLEVAEHLPFDRSTSLVEDLVATADVILFSAALPYQYGVNHINEQWPEFWAILFHAHGYSCYDCIREKIWNHPDVDWWYAQNTLIFAKDGSIASEYLKQYSMPVLLPLARVHPENFLTNVLYLHRRYRLAASAEELKDYRRIAHAYAENKTIIPRLETVSRALNSEGDRHTAFPYTRTEVSYPEQEIAELQSALEEKQILAEDLTTEISNLKEKYNKEIKNKEQTIENLTKEKGAEIKDLQSALNDKDSYIKDIESRYNEVNNQLVNIYNSHGWKVLSKYYKIRNTILPEGSKRKRFLQILFRKLPDLSKKSVNYIKTYGLKAFLKKAKEKISHMVARSTINTDLLSRIPLYPPSGNQKSKKILVINHKIPTPDKDSGSVRLFAILEVIREANEEVTFLSDVEFSGYTWVLDNVEKEIHKYIKLLSNISIKCISGRENCIDHIIKHGQQYKTVILCYPEICYFYLPLIRYLAPSAQIVYDTVDIHYLRFEREAEIKNDKAVYEKALWYKKIEFANLRSVDKIIAITRDELQLCNKISPNVPSIIVPNIHNIEVCVESIRPHRERQGIMFIGHYLHTPNEDAVIYLVNEILPIINDILGFKPDVYLLGSSITETVKALKNDQVNPIGYVEDPSSYFNGSRVFVAPLRYGAGMKGKIGQALSYGLPVVTTTIGAEGMLLVNKHNALIADDPNSFAEAIVQLYTDTVLWNEISSNGLSHIVKNFSKESARMNILSLINK